MAKIRVYELARDLNMTNKMLMDRMLQLDIPVRSHMSSLEDDVVDKIKADVLGTKAENVELVRVRPTVIRRRKKAVSVEDEAAEESAEAEEEESAEEALAEAEAPAGEETAEAEAVEVEAPAAPTEPAPEPPPRKVLEKHPARVVRPSIQAEPPATEPEETAAEAAPPEEVETPKADGPQGSEPVAEPPVSGEETTEAPAEPPAAKEPEQAAEPEKETAAPVENVAESSPTESTQAPEPTEETKKGKGKKAAKKAKKDTPAKIIKLPVPGQIPELDRRGKPEAEADAAQPGSDAAATKETDAAGDRKKKKTRRGKAEGDDKDNKFFKKKISFKRKEVVEGAALYQGGGYRGKGGRKGAKGKAAKAHSTQITTPKAIKRRIKIDETIMLSDLAKRMGIKASDIIRQLMGLGVMATVNQTLDFETASLVAAEFKFELEKASFEEEEILKITTDDAPELMHERPPVVTIMGHVDHGKTSLLDTIRKTHITEGEAGGITQHIGAYLVTTDSGEIAFLDTPGHEAFTAMRARGAKVTDIVVLVVAADDGVMPQTVEAVNHSKAAEVPIIVAVNKIDKADANPDRVKRELSDHGLVPEDWGGDTIFVPVSAKFGEGIDELLEMILLQAEVLELKANSDKKAIGHVIEARLDSGRGPVATILVQEGTLYAGDAVVCGIHHGRVRAMLSDLGETVDSATPSMPVAVLGLSGVPMAGDELVAVEDDKAAKQVSLHRQQKQRSIELAKSSRMSLEKLFDQMQSGETKELNLIIKADVHGSAEALEDSLDKLSTDEVQIKVIHSGTGTITETDISLATVSDAIIIGFNVRPTGKVSDLAAEEHVDIRYYDIIYNVIKDVKDAMVGMMESTYEDRVLGRAEVREVFNIPKVGAIAGCMVTDGKLERGQLVRVLRDGVVTYDGKIASLRRYQDDAKEVMSGYECGVGVERFNDVKVGDVLECYYLEEIKPKMD